MVPSRLRGLYWTNTLDDLRFKVGLRMENEQVRALSFTESLVDVAGMIFGSAKDETVEIEDETGVNDFMGALGWG